MEGPDTAGREHNEDEIWRDIVSRLGPAEDDSDETPPWPADEGLKPPSFSVRVIKPAGQEAAPAEPAEPEAGPFDDDEHYVPPPPPPLPSLDPITKGAWLALFGGPGYLLVCTVAGWTVAPWAAFCAVAAFVGGFITLVVRMGDGDRDESDPDDGAVV